MPENTPRTRDAALFRLSRLNRWLIAGSVALTAVLAEVAASAFPGKTLKPSSSSRAKPRSASQPSGGTSTDSGPPLAPPQEAPASGEGAHESQAPSQESQQTPAPESSQAEAPSQTETPSQEPAPQPAAPAQEQPREEAPVTSGGS